MFDIGFLEMLVIGVLALIVLGPERLPGAIKSCIQTVRSIKEVAHGFKQEVSAQIDAHELHANLKKAEELGMQNIGKDLQDSVNELKAAAASVQRPYQKAKSELQKDPLAKTNPSPAAIQADFDDHQHNDTHYSEHEDVSAATKGADGNKTADRSFDHSLLDESVEAHQPLEPSLQQGELKAKKRDKKAGVPINQATETLNKQSKKPHE